MALKIKKITFKGEKTEMVVESSEVLQGSSRVANDGYKATLETPRHADFERAFDKMKPHLLIASGFMSATDVNGNMLQGSHFNDYFADTDEEKERFGGLNLVTIECIGKHEIDSIKLIGTKEAPDGSDVPVETPAISLTRGDGYNYPLIEILDTQFQRVLLEAEQLYYKKKHGAGMQTALPLPQTKVPNVNTKKNLAVAE